MPSDRNPASATPMRLSIASVSRLGDPLAFEAASGRSSRRHPRRAGNQRHHGSHTDEATHPSDMTIAADWNPVRDDLPPRMFCWLSPGEVGRSVVHRVFASD